MNAFLGSVKDDLLDVRLRLVLVILAAALLGAVAYAVLGGGSSSTTPPGATGPVNSGVAGIAISQAPANALQPVSETTNGAAAQHGGPLRDPFTPLSPPKTAPAATSTPASSASSTTASSGSGSSTSGAATPAPAPAPKPTTPSKPKVTVHYQVTAKFGVLPAPSIEGTPPPPSALKTYSDMRLDEPLPDKTSPQVVFVGALKNTYLEAVFAVTGESILHGNGACVPSPTQCQAIRLQVGQSETFESVDASGSPVTYELKIVSIARIIRTVSSASVARAHAAMLRGESRAGRQALASDGLAALSGLQYSSSLGALVPAGQPAFGARAATAPRH